MNYKLIDKINNDVSKYDIIFAFLSWNSVFNFYKSRKIKYFYISPNGIYKNTERVVITLDYDVYNIKYYKGKIGYDKKITDIVKLHKFINQEGICFNCGELIENIVQFKLS